MVIYKYMNKIVNIVNIVNIYRKTGKLTGVKSNRGKGTNSGAISIMKLCIGAIQTLIENRRTRLHDFDSNVGHNSINSILTINV